MADDLELTHTATISSDWKGESAYIVWRRVNDTFAVEKDKTGKTTQVFIHGNIKITVRRGGVDVGKFYAVRRAMRLWEAPLDPGPPESRTGPYSIDVRGFKMDSASKPLGAWYDAPGIKQGIKITKTARLLYEWIIGCENREHELVPNLGGLYFIMVLDITPSFYKMAFSKAWNVTAQQVRDVFDGGTATLPTDQPWKPEDALQSADWVDRHVGWNTYEAHNNQLVPPAP